ncbi:MAG TPA: alcohol dehydrogenase catalytic domain-containing protein, partial [Anaerolineae bacterium]
MSLPKTMKAVVLFGQGDMRLVDDYPVPEPGPEEVIIKVEVCAICGTDPKILAEGWPNHPPYGEFVFGHEYAGKIAALGAAVTKFKLGDRVAVEPHKGCGVCDHCRDGLYTTCLNYGNLERGHRHYGFTANGGYAEYAAIHVNCVSQIPDSMSMEVATLMTTAGTSLYGIRRIDGIQAGETVVVSGPGPVGLLAVVLARLLGAGTIILTGTRPERLEIGLKLGADIAINIREQNAVERVLALTNGIGADVVLECAGAPQPQIDAVEYTKKSGRIALLGHHGQPVA